MTTSLIIADIAVKQDAEGRYCLNDLHKAAGGEHRHLPNYFFENQQTRELVAELGNTGNPVLRLRGRTGGTFVAKELVYAYAMWVSPSFNLKVIRAYDRLATQGVAVHENAAEDFLKNPLKYMRSLMEQAERLQAENLQLAETNQQLLPKAGGYDAFLNTDSYFSTTATVAALKFGSAIKLNRLLQGQGWKHSDSDAATIRALDAGWLVVKLRSPIGSDHAVPVGCP